MYCPANEQLQGKETRLVHKFQLAGLGQAPFQFAGMTESVITYPDGTSKAGSSCDYCGTGIRYEFWIESADAKRSKVGCNCVHKTGDAGLVLQISKAERELKDKKNAAAKERKRLKLVERVAKAKELLPSIRWKLAEQPHPSPYFAKEGRTLLDYVNWCFDNGAEEKACVMIELAAK